MQFPEHFPLRVGLSTCLLGQKVRYDGGHKHDRYITDILGEHFEFVPVCPEFEVGMGIPREPVHLEGDLEAPLMIGSRSGEDWTARMNTWAARRVAKLSKQHLSGYLLKKDSPSCGLERVKVTSEKGMPQKAGRGLFAAALIRELPLLPIEEEGRLHDARLRENFIVRVFAYHRLQNLFHGRWSRRQVVAFHTAHKLLLMAHSPAHYRRLGQLVAAVKDHDSDAFCQEYSRVFMEALAVRSTTRRNVNVLQHILGYLKRELDAADKQDLLSVIEDYRAELVPLVVPVTLLGHYLRKHRVAYLLDQVYLEPHPKELMLRNHV